ncbi:FkbM family methyltransferase [Arenibacterium halophilum]|nr:FkbM family methyltransferase [Arenibacterium halophilum]
MNIEPSKSVAPKSVAGRLADLLRARQAGALSDPQEEEPDPDESPDLAKVGDAPEQAELAEPAPDTVTADEIMLRVARAVRGSPGGASSPSAPAGDETALGLEDWRVEAAGDSDEADTEDRDAGVEEGTEDWNGSAGDETEDLDAETVQETEEGSEPRPMEADTASADDLLDGLSEALARVEAEDAERAALQDRFEGRTFAAVTPGESMPVTVASYDGAGSGDRVAPEVGPEPEAGHTDTSGDRGAPAVAVVAQPHGIRVPDGPGLHSKRIARMAAGTYEPREIDGALAVVSPSDVVLDLGAGTGLVGAAVARAIAPQRVIAVDPHPDLAEPLAAIYECNALASRAEVWQGVLVPDDRAPDDTSLFLAEDPVASTTLGPMNGLPPISVPCRRFADFCEEHGVTVLLADINGAELDLLRGANLSHLRALVIAFHPAVYGAEGMREAKALIQAAGFTPLEAFSNRLVWTCTRAE